MFTERNGNFYPVIDRDSAIKNLGGMVWLYEKHLSKFRNTYAGSDETITNCLISGNTEDARILIHSVKGLSGTLGLTRLYYAASILERAVIASDPAMYDFLDIYSQCLHEALSSDKND